MANDERETVLPRLFRDPQWENNLVAAKNWNSFLQDLQKEFPPNQMLPSGQNSWAAWYFLARKVVL